MSCGTEAEHIWVEIGWFAANELLYSRKKNHLPNPHYLYKRPHEVYCDKYLRLNQVAWLMNSARHAESEPRPKKATTRLEAPVGFDAQSLSLQPPQPPSFSLFFLSRWTLPIARTMNFFKTKPRTPPDLVRGLRDAIPRLETSAPGGETRRKVSVGGTFGDDGR